MVELIIDIWEWIADFFSSVWAWVTGPVLLLSDWVFLRGFVRRAIAVGLKKGWRWLVKGLIEQVAVAAQPGITKRLERSLQENLERKASEWWDCMEKKDSERWDRVEQMISERLAELHPEPPPHGITGTPVPLSGLYRLQGEHPWLVERTFEEGELFPLAPTDYEMVGDRFLGRNEEKVTWVYQTPTSGE